MLPHLCSHQSKEQFETAAESTAARPGAPDMCKTHLRLSCMKATASTERSPGGLACSPGASSLRMTAPLSRFHRYTCDSSSTATNRPSDPSISANRMHSCRCGSWHQAAVPVVCIVTESGCQVCPRPNLPVVACSGQCRRASHGCCCQHVAVSAIKRAQQLALALARVGIPGHLPGSGCNSLALVRLNHPHTLCPLTVF